MRKQSDPRAEDFQREISNEGRKLDAEFPEGSTFERTLNSYGKDGLYLVFIAGPFSNLSKDVALLTDY